MGIVVRGQAGCLRRVKKWTEGLVKRYSKPLLWLEQATCPWPLFHSSERVRAPLLLSRAAPSRSGASLAGQSSGGVRASGLCRQPFCAVTEAFNPPALRPFISPSSGRVFPDFACSCFTWQGKI